MRLIYAMQQAKSKQALLDTLNKGKEEPTMSSLTRRGFVAATATAVAGLGLAGCASSSASGSASSSAAASSSAGIATIELND